MMISKALHSKCSWSQLFYSLAKRNIIRLSNNKRFFLTTMHPQLPHGFYFQSMRKTQHVYCLSSIRVFVTSSNLYAVPNGEEENTQMRSPVSGATINKTRLDWQTAFREMVARKDGSEWQSHDWDLVAEKMSLPGGPSWEVLCMHTLYQDKSLALGRSLVDYVEQKGKPLSHIMFTFFVGLLGETSTTSVQDEETKALFDRLLATYDVLDPASIEVLASGLSHTKYYRDCLRLAEMCRETSNVGTSILLNMLLASIRYKDLDLCVTTLSMVEENIEPTQIGGCSPTIIETCLSSNNEEIFVAVMDFFKKHSLLVPLKCTEDIINAFNRAQPNKWRIQTSYIHHKSGRCVNCQYQMERSGITDSEFEAIQKAFLEQVIVGSNVFYKSTPEEVANFVKFVQRTGPYDVVIDGLNVLNRQRSPKRSDVLDRAVKHFQEQNKKVLLLGSKALVRHISGLKKFTPKPAIYMTATTKADDSFFLYAALQSGKGTLIVSKDKLRDHKFLMHPKLRHLFQQWLKRAQIYDWFFSRYGAFTIGRQHLYSIGPHRDEGGWHIPLNDIDKDYPFGNFQVLCVRDGSVTSRPSVKPAKAVSDRKRNKGEKYGKKKPSNNSAEPPLVNLDEVMQS